VANRCIANTDPYALAVVEVEKHMVYDFDGITGTLLIYVRVAGNIIILACVYIHHRWTCRLYCVTVGSS